MLGKNAKRILSGIVAVFMLAAFAGCGGTEVSSTPQSEAEASKTESAEGTPASTETIELQMPAQHIEKITENQQVRKLIEEKLNIKLTMVPLLETEALNLQIASGDVPEFFWNVTTTDYHKYIDQGLLAEIPVDTIKQNAPELAAWAEKCAGGEQAWSYYDHDGKNYSLPQLWTLATDAKVIGYRESILKESGIESAPTTVEELGSALKAMKDKLGISGLTSDNGVIGFSSLYGAFGTYQTYYEQDGKVVYGPVEAPAKEAVSLLRDWYAKGYIDPEFVINKFDNVKEKWGKDQAAVLEENWWDFLPQEAFFDGRLYEVNKDKENATNITALPPKGPTGAQGLTQGNPIVGCAVFGSQLKDQPEKMAKYLEFFNCSMNQEMMDIVNYGVEGETYNYNAETGVEWIAPYDDPDKRTEFGLGEYSYPSCFNDYDLQAKYMTQPQYLQLRQDTQKNGIGKYSIFEPFYRPVYNQKSEVLDKIWKNAHIDFITGAKPMEEWDAFVDEWMKAGGTDTIKEAQGILDNMK